jgi:hypothetical protein
MYDKEMRTKELNNGRFAMICVIGILAAELATGKDAIQQFGLSAVGIERGMRLTGSSFAGKTASKFPPKSLVASRATAAIDGGATESAPPPFNPAAQVGAMEPLGFFDPLNFTKVGDEKGFRQLRAAELKHGRVAMMASVGLLGQHFIKFPGFENTPAGFAAVLTGAGTLGFFGLAVSCSILELAWREDPSKEPGNFGDPFGVNMYDTEMRNKEISNGRFAMICVLAIFAAELATGKDAIQQFGF